MAQKKICKDCGEVFWALGPGLLMKRCRDCASSDDDE